MSFEYELQPATSSRRRALFEAATTYARDQPVEYQKIISAETITDPLGVDVEVLRRPDVPDLQLTTPVRCRWPSKTAYFFAAYCNSTTLGSVAGFLWIVPGFDLTMYTAMVGVTVAFVFLSVELALGQLFQGTATKCFAADRRTRSIGIASLIIVLLQVPVTSRFLGEQLVYFAQSFARVLPWEVTSDMALQCEGLNVADGSCDALTWCTSCEASDICYVAYFRYAYTHMQHTLLTDPTDVSVAFPITLVVGTAFGLLGMYLLARAGLRLLGQFSTLVGFSFVIYVGALALVFAAGAYTLKSEPLGPEYDYLHWDVTNIISNYNVVTGTHYTLASFNAANSDSSLSPLILVVSRTLVTVLGGLNFKQLVSYGNARVHTLAPNNTYHGEGSALWLLGDIDGCGAPHWNLDPKPTALQLLYRLQYIAFPILLSFGPCGPLLCIGFFGIVAVSTMLKSTVQFLTIFHCFKDTAVFSSTRRYKIDICVLLWFIITTAICLMNLPRLNHTGIQTGNILWTLSTQVLVPIVGCLQLLIITAVLSRGRLKVRASKYKWAYIGLLLCPAGGAVAITIIAPTSDEFFILMVCTIGVFAVLVLLLPPIFKALSVEERYSRHSYSMLIADFEYFRNQYNRIATGPGVYRRMQVYVTWLLKLVAVPCLIIAGIHQLKSALIDFDPIAAGVIMIIVTTVILLGLIIPRTFSWVAPKAENNWTLEDLPRKVQLAKYSLRRRPIRFWEEFYSADRLWKMSAQVRLHKK